MFNGAILVGASERRGNATFFAVDAASGATRDLAFSNASASDVADACGLAEAAFATFSTLTPDARATFLETVAANIARIGDVLVTTAMAETGLPRARLEGETGRTTGQLALFANVLRNGDWLEATIDPPQPDRAPLPRADLRRMNVALGPVAVFGASNFPLAFSVAGGDTAAAFAAGCPVIVKGHPAHPGTGELVARAVQVAVAACGLPDGVFSYLPGTDNALGEALVSDLRIKAVGFTGSRGGGLALMRIAAARAEPIPVYAEMSSINPVVLLPGALAGRAEALGNAFVGSLTLGAGQFCTNPGLVIAVAGPDFDRFANSAAEALAASQPATMLSAAIRANYSNGVAALAAHDAVSIIARGCVGDGITQAEGALFATDAADFASDAALGQEVFGSSSILVRCADTTAMLDVIASLEGQLTATVHLDPSDNADAARILPALSAKVGRVLCNGWPTGVEVTHAMVHGGPFPATSDGRSTSVGSLAIARFVRPVCYQDVPDALLPPALQAGNPWTLNRRVDGIVEAAR